MSKKKFFYLIGMGGWDFEIEADNVEEMLDIAKELVLEKEYEWLQDDPENYNYFNKVVNFPINGEVVRYNNNARDEEPDYLSDEEVGRLVDKLRDWAMEQEGEGEELARGFIDEAEAWEQEQKYLLQDRM